MAPERADGHLHQRTAGILMYLHGHGSSPAEVDDSVRALDPEGLVHVVTPSAKIRLPTGGGSWFDHGPRGVNPESLDGSVRWLTTLLDGLLADLDLDSSRVILAGFSQGAAMAATLAASWPKPLGGLLLQAPFLPEGLDVAVDPATVQPTTVLIQHGVNDEVVPQFLGEDLADALRVAGSRVTFESGPHGHVRTPEMFDGARRWLRALVD